MVGHGGRVRTTKQRRDERRESTMAGTRDTPDKALVDEALGDISVGHTPKCPSCWYEWKEDPPYGWEWGSGLLSNERVRDIPVTLPSRVRGDDGLFFTRTSLRVRAFECDRCGFSMTVADQVRGHDTPERQRRRQSVAYDPLLIAAVPAGSDVYHEFVRKRCVEACLAGLVQTDPL